MTINPVEKLPKIPVFNEIEEVFSLYDLEHLKPLKVPEILVKLNGFMNRFHMFVHPVVAMNRNVGQNFGHNLVQEFQDDKTDLVKKMAMMPLLQTPETRLIQYDCGKLQVLVRNILIKTFFCCLKQTFWNYLVNLVNPGIWANFSIPRSWD